MISYAIVSDKGGRERNEDCIRASEKNGAFCFALADGLGGHGYGDVASRMVCDEIIELFDNTESVDTISTFLSNAVMQGQEKLLKEQKDRHVPDSMKTTIVACIVSDEQVQWIHVGDSRLYHFKRGRLIERTADHSVPQMLAFAKEIKEKDIRFHPDRNSLLKVLGTEWDTPKYELGGKYKKLKGRRFLLCSDGFWELIDEKEMTFCLRHSRNANEWMEQMAAIVQTRADGDADNFSAICVWCD